MVINEQVREAIGRIRPLPAWPDGPNNWTVSVSGWSLNAPTKVKLSKMLWEWFALLNRAIPR